MLPTLGFVVTAYLLYALFRVWCRHHRKQFQPYRRYRWKGRLGWVGGTGVGLGIIILIAIVGIPSQYENLRTASIVTASWGQDPLMPSQAMQRQEILPIKNQGQQGQPVYAYLHPETPTPQLLSEKKGPGLRSLPKPTLRKPAPRAKGVKNVAKGPKKDKAPTKARIKKKPNAPAGTLAANAG
ncbi:MAG: hypothetical protein AB1424_06870 [Thermodesulfobacteriota bacterium]